MPLLAVNEEAERMACWVEHDAKARAVTVRWLNQCLVASQLASKLNDCLEVIHEDFEVHHLRLVSGLFGPDRGLVAGLCLNVQADAAVRIAELQPSNAVARSDDPAEQLRVERTELFGVGAVDGERRPTDRRQPCLSHDVSLAPPDSSPARPAFRDTGDRGRFVDGILMRWMLLGVARRRTSCVVMRPSGCC
jgi:hypothetical protein